MSHFLFEYVLKRGGGPRQEQWAIVDHFGGKRRIETKLDGTQVIRYVWPTDIVDPVKTYKRYTGDEAARQAVWHHGWARSQYGNGVSLTREHHSLHQQAAEQVISEARAYRLQPDGPADHLTAEIPYDPTKHSHNFENAYPISIASLPDLEAGGLGAAKEHMPRLPVEMYRSF
jgi:hypothetical protein